MVLATTLPGAPASAQPEAPREDAAARYTALKAAGELLSWDDLRGLSRLRPWRAAAAIAAEWAGIALGIALYLALGSPWLYPLLVVWIGSRMLALWVLAHEGLHQLLFPDRRANDLVTRLLLAWPIFVGLSEFRRVHLAHHAHLKTQADPEAALSAYPEFRFPLRRGRLLAVFALDLCGANALRFFLKQRYRALRELFGTAGAGSAAGIAEPGRIAFFAVALAAFAALGWLRELALFWLVPYATFFALALRMRLMAEHLHLPASEALQTRTILPTRLERWLLVPHHVHHHVEHHLYPGIPAPALPRAHALLAQRPAFARSVPLRRGYLRAFGEFVRETPASGGGG